DLDPTIQATVLPDRIKKLLGEDSPLMYARKKDGSRVPRGLTIPVDKYIGKPFMSHEVNPKYNFDDYLRSVKNTAQDRVDDFESYIRRNGVPMDAAQNTELQTRLKLAKD